MSLPVTTSSSSPPPKRGDRVQWFVVLPTSPAGSHCSRHCCSSLKQGNLNLMCPPVSECFCRWSISACCDVCCILHGSRDSCVWLHPKILDFPSIRMLKFRSEAARHHANIQSRAEPGDSRGGVASATATDLFMFQLRVQECSTQTTPAITCVALIAQSCWHVDHKVMQLQDTPRARVQVTGPLCEKRACVTQTVCRRHVCWAVWVTRHCILTLPFVALVSHTAFRRIGPSVPWVSLPGPTEVVTHPG